MDWGSLAGLMKCPRDGSELQARIYEAKIEIDACDHCGGMWLDKGELEAIQESRERDYRHALGNVSDTVKRSINEVAQMETAPIRCLKCNSEMETREYGYVSQIIIDTCPDGCGLWLDAGEIQALEKFFEASQQEAAEVIPLRYRLWASLHELFGAKKA